MSTLDWLIVAGYFAAIAALTSWVLKRRRDTADDYFLASRHLGWFVVGASIFASNIGSEHLVGPAGGVVFGVLLPALRIGAFNSFWIGSVAVVLLTGLYTVLGGMRAVVYTDALQTILLVTGSALLTIFGLKALGGWHELRAVLDPDMFNLWKPLVPHGLTGTWAAVKEPTRIAWYFNGNYPWLGMLFCAPIIGLWYWTTDQYIVQRALGARDEREARRGSICAAFLKLLPVFIFIIPGMIALALAKTGRAPGLAMMVGADGRAIPNVAQAAFPLMVTTVMPAGIRGMVVAGLLAA